MTSRCVKPQQTAAQSSRFLRTERGRGKRTAKQSVLWGDGKAVALVLKHEQKNLHFQVCFETLLALYGPAFAGRWNGLNASLIAGPLTVTRSSLEALTLFLLTSRSLWLRMGRYVWVIGSRRALSAPQMQKTDLKDKDHKAGAYDVNPRPWALLGLGTKPNMAEQAKLRRCET